MVFFVVGSTVFVVCPTYVELWYVFLFCLRRKSVGIIIIGIIMSYYYVTLAIVAVFCKDNQSVQGWRIFPHEPRGIHVERHIGFVAEIKQERTSGLVTGITDVVSLLESSITTAITSTCGCCWTEMIDSLGKVELTAVRGGRLGVQRKGVWITPSTTDWGLYDYSQRQQMTTAGKQVLHHRLVLCLIAVENSVNSTKRVFSNTVPVPICSRRSGQIGDL